MSMRKMKQKFALLLATVLLVSAFSLLAAAKTKEGDSGSPQKSAYGAETTAEASDWEAEEAVDIEETMEDDAAKENASAEATKAEKAMETEDAMETEEAAEATSGNSAWNIADLPSEAGGEVGGGAGGEADSETIGKTDSEAGGEADSEADGEIGVDEAGFDEILALFEEDSPEWIALKAYEVFKQEILAQYEADELINGDPVIYVMNTSVTRIKDEPLDINNEPADLFTDVAWVVEFPHLSNYFGNSERLEYTGVDYTMTLTVGGEWTLNRVSPFRFYSARYYDYTYTGIIDEYYNLGGFLDGYLSEDLRFEDFAEYAEEMAAAKE